MTSRIVSQYTDAVAARCDFVLHVKQTSECFKLLNRHGNQNLELQVTFYLVYIPFVVCFDLK